MKNKNKPTPPPLKWYEKGIFIVFAAALLAAGIFLICNPPKHPQGHPRFWQYQQPDTTVHH